MTEEELLFEPSCKKGEGGSSKAGTPDPPVPFKKGEENYLRINFIYKIILASTTKRRSSKAMIGLRSIS
jgi:hypothetical protein